MDAVVWDIADDGYCGGVQIRYEIYDGGWTGHWHYRYVPVVDRSNNTTRYMAARACHARPDGSIVRCESNGHWVS